MLKSLVVSNIVLDDTSLQSWNQTRDLLLLCPELESLSLVVGDDALLELPTFLHPNTKLSHLLSLEISCKCPSVSEQLIVELLRACPIGGLVSVRLARCLTNFSATGWFLIAERGGSSLKILELTPAVQAKLGWEESIFSHGVQQLVKSCPSIEFLDLSGHGCGFDPKVLALYLEKMVNLKHIFRMG
jgi:hypothetical protein